MVRVKPLHVCVMNVNFNPLVRQLRATAIGLLAPLIIMSSLLWSTQPAMAKPNYPLSTPITLGAMSKRIDATAKDAEGKLESTYGDSKGDKGHQLKGKAKQVQASAMNAAEDVKEGARSVGKKVADSTDQK
jgi:uncharacterized protein YjbJ (UPF0337 family)